MENKIVLVIKREYTKTIKKRSFWIATLMGPVLIALITFISSYSGMQSKSILNQQASSAKQIIIVDEANVINKHLLVGPYKSMDNVNEAISQIKDNKANAVFVYPSDIDKAHSIDIYMQNKNIFSNTQYNGLAEGLLKTGILNQIKNKSQIALYEATYNINVTPYQNGNIVNQSINNYVVPIVGIFLYFIAITFGVSYLLLSLSEEKENRMIETIITIIKPFDFITGKIIGQVLLLLTQIVIFAGITFFVLYFEKNNLPFNIDVTQVLNYGQILLVLFYVVSAFCIIACTMVGISGLMPTYRDAQRFSSSFIIISILPIYIVTLILAEPNSPLAIFFSYFPFTSGMVLIFRNALNATGIYEVLISIGSQVIYVILFFLIATKLFEIGSIEYNNKVSIKQVLNTILHRSNK